MWHKDEACQSWRVGSEGDLKGWEWIKNLELADTVSRSIYMPLASIRLLRVGS